MAALNTKDFLISGRDVLAAHPDFKLIGRDADLEKLAGILLRRSAPNVLLIGPGGVGCSALCLGLRARKDDPTAPLDLVGKRIYWLDTDSLFASGDHTAINEGFQKMMRTLSRTETRDAILIVEDFRNFVDAARDSGSAHFINSMMREIKRGRFQAVFEARDDDLEVVLKTHADMNETFTTIDLLEPQDAALQEIVFGAAKHLSAFHKIRIEPDAIQTAIDLTSQYRLDGANLNRAQPARSLTLLDRALASYRQNAHSSPPVIQRHQAELERLERALANADDGQSQTALAQEKEKLEATLAGYRSEWDAAQAELRRLAEEQRKGEDLLRLLGDELDAQIEADDAKAKDDPDARDEAPPPKAEFFGLADRMRMAGGGSAEAAGIRSRIEEAEQVVGRNKQAFDDLTAKINATLELTPAEVYGEFSRISGIPTNRLNQDERQKLLNLADALKARVFGQDHAMNKLADGIIVARANLKEPNQPETAFLYCGPSGVGKTETAKALALILKDDERALARFDMSEYMEKHAVAKLIGAPPGYEGYEAGGILTNTVRRNPHLIILFDEIEKAHPDVFNVMLQVLDDGRLTDNRGLTVDFSQTVIIMTTNIGQSHALDENLTQEEAMAATLADLDDTYRPEFLNRFNGRENIVCFNKLELPTVELIVKHKIRQANAQVQAEHPGIDIVVDDATVSAICKAKYDPRIGARGIPGYLKAKLYPAIARSLFTQEGVAGRIQVAYDPEADEITASAPSQPSAEARTPELAAVP